MPDDDLISGFLAGVSAIIAVFSYFTNLQPISSIGSFLTGAFVTYFIQTRLQDRTRKNQIRIRNIEEIFVPLYIEIANIRESLLEVPEGLKYSEHEKWNDSWVDISSSYKKFVLGSELEKELGVFYEKIDELNTDLASTSKIVINVLNDQFMKYFLPLIDKPAEVKKDDWNVCYTIEYIKKYRRDIIRYLNKYIMIKKNPIEEMLNIDKDFSLEKCYTTYREIKLISDDYGTEQIEIRTQLKLSEYYSQFKSYLKKVESIISKDEVVQRIRLESRELLELAKKFESKLFNHIRGHYPIEKIK